MQPRLHATPTYLQELRKFDSTFYISMLHPDPNPPDKTVVCSAPIFLKASPKQQHIYLRNSTRKSQMHPLVTISQKSIIGTKFNFSKSKILSGQCHVYCRTLLVACMTGVPLCCVCAGRLQPVDLLICQPKIFPKHQMVTDSRHRICFQLDSETQTKVSQPPRVN